VIRFSNVRKIQSQPIPIEIEYRGKIYKGEGFPLPSSCEKDACFEVKIYLNNEDMGVIHCTDNGWRMDKVQDQELVNAIGEEIFLWYE
jgi:hypothetical protein